MLLFSNQYSYSDLVFCMAVKILLCLPVATFMTYYFTLALHSSGDKHKHALIPMFKGYKINFLPFQEENMYSYLWYNVPLN
jgi:hypothetical protein